MDEKIAILRSAIGRFVAPTDQEWDMLAPWLSVKTIKKHELFCREGERADLVGFMLSGTMRHYYTRDGIEKTTYFYFENHFVSSYISCITGQPSQLTFEALAECELIVFPYHKMKQLFKQSILWQEFGRLIAEYLAKGLEERMAGLLMLSPEERYLALISSDKTKILERIPQHYIANYLGITPVSMSRIRNRVTKK